MIIDAALPIPINRLFSYTVPDAWKSFVKPLVRVTVPFHHNTQTGVIISVRDDEDPLLKEMVDLVDFFPLIDNRHFELVRWVSHHYLAPPGFTLKYVFPRTLNLESYLSIRATSGETAPFDNMSLKKAISIAGRIPLFRYYQEELISLQNTFNGGDFLPLGYQCTENTGSTANILFIGEIGSRIDYYCAAIKPLLQQGLNVLMLLPDLYASGAYYTDILSERFGNRVIWYGTGVTPKSRMATFLKAREQGGHLILGNKSCAFLPIHRLGLAIIERPEEDDYRNEEGIRFNAALVAIMRSSIFGHSVIVGSASPSLEIYNHAKKRAFHIIKQRWILDTATQEKISSPDLRSSAVYLEELIPIIKEGTENSERIAIFLPRKQYGSYLMCHTCRSPVLCPQCGGILDYDKKAGCVSCPACKINFPYEERCSSCGSTIIRFSRIGVEYVEEKIRSIYPGFTIIKITGDSLRKEIKGLAGAIAGNPTILIGTQSLTKLYGFPVDRLILLGWEEMRKMGGYRADEKMVQTLVNLVDALNPRTITIFMAKRNKVSVDSFLEMEMYFEKELRKRGEAELPPFVRTFLVEVEKKGKDAGANNISRIKHILREEGVNSYLSGNCMEKHSEQRWRMILRGDDIALFAALSRIRNLPRVQVEADPLFI